PRASHAKAPTEPFFPETFVAPRWLAAAVERLFCAVVNTGYSGRRQVDGKRIEYQLAILNHAAKPAFLASFVYLIVVVKHRDHVLAEPGEIPMVVQCRVPKERETLSFGSARPFTMDASRPGISPTPSPPSRPVVSTIDHACPRPPVTSPARKKRSFPRLCVNS